MLTFPRPLRAVLLVPLIATLPLLPACGRSSSEAPPVPAAADPEGKDLVDGAVVAAIENSGGYRLYKIIHVEFMPAPLGQELHMIAYDPKGKTFEDAAQIWARHEAKVLSAHITVNKVNFMTRDRRVLATEKVTDEERTPYLRSIR